MSFWDTLGAIGSGITTGTNALNTMYTQANGRQQSDIATQRLQDQYDADADYDLFNATAEANVGALEQRTAQQQYATQQAADAYQMISPEYRAEIAAGLEERGGSSTSEGQAYIAQVNDELGRVEQNARYNQTEQARQRAEDIIISRVRKLPTFAGVYAIGRHPDTGGLIGFTGALDENGASREYIDLPAQVMQDYYNLLAVPTNAQPTNTQPPATTRASRDNVTSTEYTAGLRAGVTARARELVGQLRTQYPEESSSQLQARAKTQIDIELPQIQQQVLAALQQRRSSNNAVLAGQGATRNAPPSVAQVTIPARPARTPRSTPGMSPQVKSPLAPRPVAPDISPETGYYDNQIMNDGSALPSVPY